MTTSLNADYVSLMVSNVHQPTAECLFCSPSSRLTCCLLQQPKLSSINASHNRPSPSINLYFSSLLDLPVIDMLWWWGFMWEVLVVGTVGHADLGQDRSLVTVRDEAKTGRGSSMSCSLFVIGGSCCGMAVMLLPWSGFRSLEAEGLVVVAVLPMLGKTVKALL
ncbi:hypothetical protein ACLOJK_029541 [Asimina triloba]